MATLAVVILFIVAMNYVLIAIASIGIRAKGVGVHKANGATAGDIFKMFVWETALVILMALAVVALVVINFREYIEELVSVNLLSLFTLNTLWAPLVVILLLFLFAAFLPTKLFSSLPVTHIFRRYTDKKAFWKRPLLFVQFTGVTFIFGLLLVIWVQYQNIIDREPGYSPKNLVYFPIKSEGIMSTEYLKDELKKMPFVKAAGMTHNAMTLDRYSGIGIYLKGNYLFSARYCRADLDFINTVGFELIEGENFDAPGQVIVNESYLKQFNWPDGAIGKQV